MKMPGRCGTRSVQFSGARIADGRRHELVVLRIARIGADDEAVVPVLDVIFDAGNARRDEAGLVIGLLRIDEPEFGGVMVVDVDHDPFL